MKISGVFLPWDSNSLSPRQTSFLLSVLTQMLNRAKCLVKPKVLLLSQVLFLVLFLNGSFLKCRSAFCFIFWASPSLHIGLLIQNSSCRVIRNWGFPRWERAKGLNTSIPFPSGGALRLWKDNSTDCKFAWGFPLPGTFPPKLFFWKISNLQRSWKNS